MKVGENIRRLREQRGVKQQEIADLIGMHRSNYSKIESGQREISIAALDKIASFFNVTLDELVHMGEEVPEEVTIEDKTVLEQLKLIEGLEEEDKHMIFKMIDTFLTKKKFKDFFNKNVASL
jgi:transcriptional regulator with XRE-family HTH domain